MQRSGWVARRRVLAVTVATALGVLLPAGIAQATTYVVNDPGDYAQQSGQMGCSSTHNGSCTLRAAVQAADEAGGSNTITLPAGTYTLTIAATGADEPSNGDLDVTGGASLTVTGAGSASTIVDANGIDRAFAVQSGASLSLAGMTIENGNPSSSSTGDQDGGAIYSDGDLAITGDVTFKDNSSLGGGGQGGAIFAGSAAGSALAVSGATFTQNTASVGGGAIYQDLPSGTATIANATFNSNLNGGGDDDDGGAIAGGGGGLSISSSSFTGNDAVYGGGIYWNAHTPVSITSSTFADNSGDWELGGAVYDVDSSSMTVSSDRFTGDTGGYGGALYLDSSSGVYTLDQDEFDGNASSLAGGAIAWYAGSLSANGSSFVDNTTAAVGGAIYDDSGGALSLINTTISDGTASYGGGIYFDTDSPTTMTNDTIAFNTAGSGDGGGVYNPGDAEAADGSTGLLNTIIAENAGGDCGGSELAASADAGHNLDGDSSCFGGLGVGGDRPGTNPLLGHAADNGGPVQTNSEQIGSPAIDAGSNDGCPATDARGIARPQGASCDIGAFEWAAARLALTKSAPEATEAGLPFQYTITVADGGPGYSTGTTVVDPLPFGETLLNVSTPQGTCAGAGSPTTVTCDLGLLGIGQQVTLTLTVTTGAVGGMTNTATVTNDQGSRATSSATIQVTVLFAAVASAGGKLVLDSKRLTVRDGSVFANFTCDSRSSCDGNFSIEKRGFVGASHLLGAIVCTKSRATFFRIGANERETVKAPITRACLAMLRQTKLHQTHAKLSSRPRTGQLGVIEAVTLVLK